MAGIFGGGSSGPDYVQPNEPADPESPERWFDTDDNAMKVYGTDGTWHTITIDDHSELGGVLADNHHQYPIPTSGLVDGAVTAAKAAFDVVTPTEFQNHTGDDSAHWTFADESGSGTVSGVYDETRIVTVSFGQSYRFASATVGAYVSSASLNGDGVADGGFAGFTRSNGDIDGMEISVIEANGSDVTFDYDWHVWGVPA